MNWLEDKATYEKLARQIEPTAILTTNLALVWVWVLGVILTLGFLPLAISWKKFLDQYSMTVGPVQGYPRRRVRLARRLIVHECGHSAQVAFVGWFVPVLGWLHRKVRVWVGLPFWLVIYFLVLRFPFMRFGCFYCELDADRRVWRWWMAEEQVSLDEIEAYILSRVDALSGREYVWAVTRGFALKRYKRAFDKDANGHFPNRIKK